MVHYKERIGDKEVQVDIPGCNQKLILQKVIFHNDNGSSDIGFCFDRVDSQGRSLTGRGRTNIPTEKLMLKLIALAYDSGWFNPFNEDYYKD